MLRGVMVAAAALAVAAGLGVSEASAARGLQVGLFDEPQVLGNPTRTFPILRTLRVQVVRINLYWGGPSGVAARRPGRPLDPRDPAYNWSQYDAVVRIAARYRIKVLFSIYGTPAWANGLRLANVPPRRIVDLRNFAFAAAKRYSGTFVPDLADPDSLPLPPVRYWLAWNEPNNPAFLVKQYRRVSGRWVIQSAVDYARICNAVYAGVKLTFLAGQKVACGGTSPRGNNQPTRKRPSVSPLVFLRAAKKAGMRRFDAYAHHPYYGSRFETPASPPKGGLKATAITLGNINTLVAELTRLYGQKRLWITEYGYQTNPPDRLFGVSWSKQAAYLRQAHAIARRHPRIDMLLWFMLRDDIRPGGWQSGFLTVSGRRKPSFTAFRLLPR